MTIIENIGTRVKGRYLADASEVEIDGEYLDILAESDDYIALFSRGKSVYKRGHSEYSPTRILFCEIHSLEAMDGRTQTREAWIDLTIHLVSPVRRP